MTRHVDSEALTIALNPSVDKTQIVRDFTVGHIHRVEQTVSVAGGKANNAARVLRTLGHTVRATGFIAGPNGDWIAQSLLRNDIEAAFVPVPGNTRTSVTIIDEAKNTTTELREAGAAVPAEAQDELLRRLPALAAGCRVAVISGSLPPGIAPDYLAELIRRLRALDVPVLLDASGPALVAGLGAGPTLIKPNEDELRELAELLEIEPTPTSAPRTGEPVPEALSELVAVAAAVAPRFGVDVAASFGGHGAFFAGAAGESFAVPAPRLDAVNPVGAGDSFVAGLASGLLQELDPKSIVRLAVACGSASVLHREVAVVDPADVEKFLRSRSSRTLR